MKYNRPELQLVGAANNVVLGLPKSILGDNYDAGDETYQFNGQEEQVW